METVRRLPCNWKWIEDGDLIETVEYAPVELMRRAGCRGEVRLCRLVSRGIASLGNRHGVMTTIAYLTLFLLSPHLRRRCCLLIFGEDREREEVEVRGEKKEEEKVLTAFVVVVVFFDG